VTSSTSESLSDLSGEAELLAAALSQTYQLFLQALTYPDEAHCQWIREGGLADPLRQGFAAISPALEQTEERWTPLRGAYSVDELAVEYTRLFDAGASGPPCPLYGGLYGGARMKTMEEAVRFYNHFGLTLSEKQRELPDHIATELEFLHYLTFREAEALHSDADAGPYRRAQRDFVTRHPGAWLPKLCQRLEKEKAHPFFLAIFGCLADLLAHEGARLGGVH
jgi:DMSO reductase family type II enzyme chaperone